MKSTRLVTAALAAVALSVPLTLVASAAPQIDDLSPGHATKSTLRREAPKGFHIGTAVAGGGHHENQPYPDPFTSDQPYRKVLAAEFNSVSAENQMKWEYIHPEQGRYNFGMADAIVRFAKQNKQVVRGHTLLWHSQNPTWLEQGNFTPAELRSILRDHIKRVVGRYRGSIQQWDVANEIFTDTGELRTTENIWLRELGPGIIADAFRWAHEADPKAKLFLNDYGVESVNAKSDAYLALIKQLRAQHVPVGGFSAQSHLSIRYGFPSDLETNLKRFSALGLDTAITELDVRMDLPADGVPTAAQLAQQADYYTRTLTACLNVDGCDSFTIWGFTDKYSWVPVFFPGQGAATVMWDDFSRKPAYFALKTALDEASRR
jgi:endo-1,4-beta-xylanase